MIREFKDFVLLLWFWGSFPLSFVTYTAIACLSIGVILGRYL